MRHSTARGRSNGNAALTENQVRAIRRALGEGISAVELAQIYLVSAETIRRIKSGATWGWLDAGAESAGLPLSPLPPPTEAEQAAADASLARLQGLLKGEGK